MNEKVIKWTEGRIAYIYQNCDLNIEENKEVLEILEYINKHFKGGK